MAKEYWAQKPTEDMVGNLMSSIVYAKHVVWLVHTGESGPLNFVTESCAFPKFNMHVDIWVLRGT